MTLYAHLGFYFFYEIFAKKSKQETLVKKMLLHALNFLHIDITLANYVIVVDAS